MRSPYGKSGALMLCHSCAKFKRIMLDACWAAPPESLIEVDLVAVSPKPIDKFPKCEMVTDPRNRGIMRDA